MEIVSTGGALRRAAASGGGVVCASFVMLSIPQKSAVAGAKYRVTGPLVGSFRSIGEHLAPS